MSERALKDLELEQLAESWKEAPLAVCADYRGLTVAQITKLRNELRKVGASSKVVKNTLARISVERSLGSSDTGQVGKLVDTFQGPSFLVFVNEDIVGSAKVLEKFSKDHEAFQVKGGWFEGAFLDKAGVAQISKMPSREELLAKVLYLINAPATQLARVIKASGQQMVQVLEAHRSNLS